MSGIIGRIRAAQEVLISRDEQRVRRASRNKSPSVTRFNVRTFWHGGTELNVNRLPALNISESRELLRVVSISTNVSHSISNLWR